MKTINTLILSILATVCLSAQATLPHTETFDDPAASTWTSAEWTIASSQANVAGEATDTYLVGPVFDFSSLTQVPSFTFFYANDDAGDLSLEVIVDGGAPLQVWSSIATLAIGETDEVDGSDTNYLTVIGASSVQFRFKALANVIAWVNDIDISESPATGSGYDITYSYDAAGNRNGRTSILTTDFVSDENEISQIKEALSVPLAGLEEAAMFD